MRLKSRFVKKLLPMFCLFAAAFALAGEIDSPAPPDDQASAMPSMEDLYLRLVEGSEFLLRETFVEPGSGPASTGVSLMEIMSVAPVADDVEGATTDEVTFGRSFWGLRTDGSGWGLLTGTMASQSIDSTTTQQAGGLYSAFDLAQEDSDLHEGNIRAGTTVFGVAGTVNEATGDAAAGDVLIGKTFSTVSGSATGTMEDNGAVVITPGPDSQSIPVGFHDGTGMVAGDVDLDAANIKAGATVFGVVGTVVEATGDATAGDVLIGKTFSSASGPANGTMEDNGAVVITPGPDNQTILVGFHDGAGVVEGDADLDAVNIKTGVEIFGVEGVLNGGCSCEGTMNGARWCNNLDGTVTDLTTCLVWLRRADWGQFHSWIDQGDGYHSGANSRASFLEDGDLGSYLSDGSVAGDWRLPTLREASGLTSEPEGISFDSPGPFVGVADDNYWTSAVSRTYADFAWTIGLGNGQPALAPKVNIYRVWAVRSAF